MNQDPGIAPARKKGATVHLSSMRRAFRRLGVEVLEVDDDEPGSVLSCLESAWARGPIDLVYERYSLEGVAASDFARRRSVPLVLEVNAPLAEEEATWRRGADPAERRMSEERVFVAADRVIAVSSEVARYARERGAANVRVLHNGVDTDLFRPREPDDPLRSELVPKGRFALGFHGRLRPWHGLERLVRTAGRLIASGTPLQLVLVGEGDFSAAEALPAGHVTRVPWVDHEEVGHYVATFDALPLTYSPDSACYFSPLKLPEAMAAGVVPIVPALGDLPDLVTDGVDGVVYPADDLEALERAIARLATTPGEHASLSAGAVRKARAYSWTEIARYALGAVSGARATATADSTADSTEGAGS